MNAISIQFDDTRNSKDALQFCNDNGITVLRMDGSSDLVRINIDEKSEELTSLIAEKFHGRLEPWKDTSLPKISVATKVFDIINTSNNMGVRFEAKNSGWKVIILNGRNTTLQISSPVDIERIGEMTWNMMDLSVNIPHEEYYEINEAHTGFIMIRNYDRILFWLVLEGLDYPILFRRGQCAYWIDDGTKKEV